jgi:hypothetical protein
MRSLVATALVMLFSGSSFAQAPPALANGVTCATNLTPKPTAVVPADRRCKPENVWELRMGDRVAVQIHGLTELRKQRAPEAKALRLFIDGIELKNLTLHHETTDDATQTDSYWTRLEFDNENQDNRKAWVQLLQTARDRDDLIISIGPEGGPPFPSTARASLNIYPTGYTVFTVTAIAVLCLALLVLAAKSNLLRGAGTSAGPPPYSLARHQMAVWFLVVISAYLFVALVTGAAAATSPTALILIGISGATGLAAIAIDSNQCEEAARARQALAAEDAALRQLLDEPVTGLRAQLANAPPASPEFIQLTATVQSKVQRLNEVAALLAKPAQTSMPSRGWLRDILSDENGISFHRLQIVGWTVVLVGVFIRTVWRDVAMPDFDATTLGLMGISSGTYLGFKIPK